MIAKDVSWREKTFIDCFSKFYMLEISFQVEDKCMLTISSAQDLLKLKTERSVITLYLDDGYSRETINAIVEAREGFNHDVERSWHMMIPYKGASPQFEDQMKYAIGINIDAKDYDLSFAQKIIRRIGISRTSLPALIFENFSIDGTHYVISLSGMNKQSVLDTIRSISEIVQQRFENGRNDPDVFRQDVTDTVRNDRRLKSLIGYLKVAAPYAARGAGGAF